MGPKFNTNDLVKIKEFPAYKEFKKFGQQGKVVEITKWINNFYYRLDIDEICHFDEKVLEEVNNGTI